MRQSASTFTGLTILLLSGGEVAVAAEMTASALFAQRFEVDSDSEDDSSGFRSVTDVGFRIEGATPRTTWNFAPGIRTVLDPDGFTPQDDIRPRIGGGFTTLWRRSDLSGALSILPETSDFSDAQDGELRRGDVIEIRSNASLSFGHQLTTRDRLALGVDASRRDFTETGDGLAASRRYGVSTTASRALDAVTSVSLTGGFRRFEADDEDVTNSLSLTLGGARSLTPTLSVNGSAGVSYLLESSEPGLLGGLDVSWRATPTMTLTFGASQDFSQSDSGELRNLTALRGGVSAELTPRTRVTLATRLSSESATDDDAAAAGGSTIRFAVSPAVAYRLTEDWRIQVGGRFVVEDDDGVEETAAMFISLSRGISLLP